MDWTGNVENIEWSSSDGFLATTLVIWLLVVFVRIFKQSLKQEKVTGQNVVK